MVLKKLLRSISLKSRLFPSTKLKTFDQSCPITGKCLSNKLLIDDNNFFFSFFSKSFSSLFLYSSLMLTLFCSRLWLQIENVFQSSNHPSKRCTRLEIVSSTFCYAALLADFRQGLLGTNLDFAMPLTTSYLHQLLYL